jgi:hypothetical protein
VRIHRASRTESKYWRIVLERPERLRLTMRPGDVVIRPSTLWHRGMPNHTPHARPTLAFTREDGGSLLEDPYAAHQGQITFLPNRYQTDWASRLRERAFVAMPGAGAAFRAVALYFERVASAAVAAGPRPSRRHWLLRAKRHSCAREPALSTCR